MKFVDFISIEVLGGRGGNGCLSFRREKFVPKGGPDGANGGRGGDVILQAAPGALTLADFEYQKKFQADNGGPGKGSLKSGFAGKDLVISVPCGTIVYDSDTGEIIADLVDPGERVVAAKGGRPGRGNAHFANSVRKSPRFAEKGDEGENRNLLLELKLIADVGLVGVPNAGKSSILAAISNARPKIAGYPFTTLSPNLGVLSVDDQKIILADVPGLIEGAHENKGLGIYFLRHVERTRFLAHILDLGEESPEEVIRQWRIVREEFQAYNDAAVETLPGGIEREDLLDRPYVVLGNKIDLPGARENDKVVRAFMEEQGISYYTTSALTGEGIDEFIAVVAELVRANVRGESSTRLVEPAAQEVRSFRRKLEPVTIVKLQDNSGYRVLHTNLEKTLKRYDFDHEDALLKFARLVKKFRIEEKLEESGAVKGDKVYIGELEFDFEPDRVME
ncbi:MAG: GTPase ObgE [Synergistaceae bacterium]|nr:GTPase ObgE [Synergistaceae bacterium]